MCPCVCRREELSAQVCSNMEIMEHVSPSFLGVAGSVIKMSAAFRVVTL